MEEKYILHHALCSECVWSEEGFYNFMCVHCPYASFSKKNEPSFMSRATAEMVGLVKPKNEEK